MYYTFMRPFAHKNRVAAEETTTFFLSYGGKPIDNIGIIYLFALFFISLI